MDVVKGLSLFFQILAAILAVLSYLGIKSENLPFLQPFLSIPWYFYIIAILILIIFFLTWKENKSRTPTRVVAFARNLVDIDEFEYNDVYWVVRGPQQNTYETKQDYENRIVNSIEVKVPPKCPICGVELEQSKSWIFGYIWRCIDCGFKKRNKDSYYTEAKRAEKIYKRDLEVTLNSRAK